MVEQIVMEVIHAVLAGMLWVFQYFVFTRWQKSRRSGRK